MENEKKDTIASNARIVPSDPGHMPTIPEREKSDEEKAFDKIWRDYINDPQNRIYLRVQKKDLDRKAFRQKILDDAEKRGVSMEAATYVADDIDKALFGFDIIDDLVSHDDSVSDIRLVSENDIRIKRFGKRLPALDKFGRPLRFESKEAYIRFIEHITTRNNTNTAISNAAQVFTDKDSSENSILRFSLVSDLVNTNDRPTLLIRKILKHKKTMDRLVREKYMTPEQRTWITNRWTSGHSFLICGPNGSGKTTLINAVLDVTPKDRSCDVIQESEELFCDSHPEMVFRRIVPKRNNSTISYSIVDLGRLALMESFDIIVIGEVKGPEAAQIAYATYTGSQCMTSVHSISAHDGYQKMIDYAMESDSKMTAKQYANQFQAMDTVIYVKDYHVSQIVTAKYNPDTEGYFDFHDVYNEETGVNRIDPDGQERPMSRPEGSKTFVPAVVEPEAKAKEEPNKEEATAPTEEPKQAEEKDKEKSFQEQWMECFGTDPEEFQKMIQSITSDLTTIENDLLELKSQRSAPKEEPKEEEPKKEKKGSPGGSFAMMSF
jgi:pilus assembly protein CpaF